MICDVCNIERKHVSETKVCIYFYCSTCKDTIVIFMGDNINFWKPIFYFFMSIETFKRGLKIKFLDDTENTIKFKFVEYFKKEKCK